MDQAAQRQIFYRADVFTLLTKVIVIFAPHFTLSGLEFFFPVDVGSLYP